GSADAARPRGRPPRQSRFPPCARRRGSAKSLAELPEPGLHERIEARLLAETALDLDHDAEGIGAAIAEIDECRDRIRGSTLKCRPRGRSAGQRRRAE